MIKGLIFDYGGTIDTNGIHWAQILWRYYLKSGIQIPHETFRSAYSYGERALAINPLVKESDIFYDVLVLKIAQQFSFLKKEGYLLEPRLVYKIASECNAFAKENVERAKPILTQLSREYPLVIVSNFYGNIQSVLRDFEILDVFQGIIESAVVGVRKPNPEIYSLGISYLELMPPECLIIGDSFTKDIVPAKKLGCQTVWLNVEGWEEAVGDDEKEIESDHKIVDLKEVLNLV